MELMPLWIKFGFGGAMEGAQFAVCRHRRVVSRDQSFPTQTEWAHVGGSDCDDRQPAPIVAGLEAEVVSLRAQLEEVTAERDKNMRWYEDVGRHRSEELANIRAERDSLIAAIEEYSLWEPGKLGHAAAHRKLLPSTDETETT